MKKNYIRLDDLLVKKGMAHSKSFAQSLIMSGKIMIKDKISDKPGRSFLLDTEI
jgi:23S rRNA (cytidine1920-2'-O)/16S rRNA (cytidine1409-2'-O)-methyltransferase